MNYEPFGSKATDRDPFLKNLIKSIGFRLDVRGVENSGRQGAVDEVFVKRSETGIAVGAYVPFYIAQKIAINVGTMYRRTFTTDSNHYSLEEYERISGRENSATTWVRIAYITGHFEWGVGYEKAYKGFDYRAWTTSAGIRF